MLDHKTLIDLYNVWQIELTHDAILDAEFFINHKIVNMEDRVRKFGFPTHWESPRVHNLMHGYIDAWMDKWPDGCIEWMDGRMAG